MRRRICSLQHTRHQAKGYPYQYSLRPPCIWRGALAWLETTPNVVLLRFVCGPPNTTRLKILNASARKSTRNRSEMLKVLARLTFSFKPGNTRTCEFLRGELPRTPTGWTGNTLAARYLSLFGSKDEPEIGARQSYVVTNGRFVPLKIGSVPFAVTPIGNPEKYA